MKKLIAVAVIITGIFAAQSLRAAVLHSSTVDVATALQNATNTTLTSTASLPMNIPQGVPINFIISTVGAGATTGSNYVVRLDVSDGVNWTTRSPIALTNTLTGTTTNTQVITVPASILQGFSQFRVGGIYTDSVTNATLCQINCCYLY